jgi:hypothetical protein
MMVHCMHVISMVSERSFADIAEDCIHVNSRICLRAGLCSKFHLYALGHFCCSSIVPVTVVLFRSRHKISKFSILGDDMLMTSIGPIISKIKVLDVDRRQAWAEAVAVVNHGNHGCSWMHFFIRSDSTRPF